MEKKIVWVLIGVICALLLGCSDFFSSSGNGDENTIVWTKRHSPIYIDGCYVVPEGKTLIIQPGVEVRFKSSDNSADFRIDSLDVGMLYVRGELIAEGTSTDSIVFTCENNRWGVIFFDSTATGNSKLKHCKIMKARNIVRSMYGLPDLLGAVSSYKTKVDINNCQIADNNWGVLSYQSELGIENNKIINNSSFGILSYYSTNTITENEIKDNSYGIWGENDMNTIISNNNFIDNDKAIYCRRMSNIYIINNTFLNNEYIGIDYEKSTAGSIIGNIISNSSCGIICSWNSSPDIINNTIVNSSYAIRFKMDCNPDIRNCILWYNDQPFSFAYSNSPIISYSLIQGDSLPPDIEDGGKNIFNHYPHFVNIYRDNFQLQENSPCVNKGNSIVPDLPETDILGNPRISGPAVDIGAYEYQESK